MTKSENVEQYPLGRKLDFKICQTDTLILLSIVEPGLTESEVNVMIETESIIVEIAKEDVRNPVISGRLFGTVEKGHCRVRIKDDSIVIKLRKTIRGRWKSILSEVDTDFTTMTPTSRVHPQRGVGRPRSLRKPISPSRDDALVANLITVPTMTPTLACPSNRSNSSRNPIDAELIINDSESKVRGVMDDIRQFHDSLLFDTEGYWTHPEEDTTETEESLGAAYPGFRGGLLGPRADPPIEGAIGRYSMADSATEHDSESEQDDDEEVLSELEDIYNMIDGTFIKTAESMLGNTSSNGSGGAKSSASDSGALEQ